MEQTAPAPTDVEIAQRIFPFNENGFLDVSWTEDGGRIIKGVTRCTMEQLKTAQEEFDGADIFVSPGEDRRRPSWDIHVCRLPDKYWVEPEQVSYYPTTCYEGLPGAVKSSELNASMTEICSCVASARRYDVKATGHAVNATFLRPAPVRVKELENAICGHDRIMRAEFRTNCELCVSFTYKSRIEDPPSDNMVRRATMKTIRRRKNKGRTAIQRAAEALGFPLRN